MRHLIVGDIHGCFVEFQELLQVAGLADDDRIIALGDIVDRGPDSPRVLAWFAGASIAISLMGNHERKHVRSRRGELRPALSQLIARRQFGDAAYERACAAMELFPRSMELPDAILTHGFFEPGVPLTAQRETVLIGTLSGEQYLQSSYAAPWYTLYDGEKPLIVGHHDYLQTGQPLVHDDKVYAIDTGCCHGGRLTGLVLPEFRIVSVPAKRDHWTELQRQYAEIRWSAVADEHLTWASAQAIAEARQDCGNDGDHGSDRRQQVQQLLQAGENAVSRLLEEVQRQYSEALALLRNEDSSFDRLAVPEQRRRFSARIGSTPLSKFLYLARKGLLQHSAVRDSFKGPYKAVDFARRVGVVKNEGAAG